MNNISKEEHSLILKAQKESDIKQLKRLSKNQYSNVRRCVAKNLNTNTDILNLLALDPVKNVSYAALKNIKCTIKRDLSYFSEKCVLCPINESQYINKCRNCS